MFRNRITPFHALPIVCFAAMLPLLVFPHFADAAPTQQEAQTKSQTVVQVSFTFVISTPAHARKRPQLQALLDSGAKIIAAPRIQTLDNSSAEFKSSQQIPYLIGSGDNTKTATFETGVHVRVVPHLNPDKTVQLDIDADNSEPTSRPSQPLTVAKYGVFNITQVKLGQETIVGTWMQQGKLITIFATVTLPSVKQGE